MYIKNRLLYKESRKRECDNMQKNVSKPKPDETTWNFCLIFKITLENFERIRKFALDNGAILIYQTRATGRIFVQKCEGEIKNVGNN